ncbi:O-antigen translocase [Flavivirga spongiicola]|uniref:O-antigen translocase n=1 Tax=Flavivirga spongiicola TaxID=421621 RepID=A0ABU7XWF0_9FLAO|nr:O-antigen translocase [Flavivirga sp. MEBiC05379]MDO5980110.1 O-antigen translocase [Flavivirga sp. MEBiC05379]
MNLYKTSIFSGISTIISLVTRLITNKIIAVYLGTNGLFLLGQLKDFLRIAQEISILGISNGIVKYTANHKNNETLLKEFLSTGFKTHVYFSVLVLFLTIIFNKSLSYYLFNDYQYSTFLIITAFSVASISIHTFLMSVLNGLGNIKLYVAINIIATLSSAVILIILTLNFKLLGAFYAVTISQFLTFFISLLLIIIIKPFNFKLITHSFEKEKFKKLSRFSVMSIVGTTSLISATLFVRHFLSIEIDENHAGAWEGMWRISAVYLLFFTTTFSFYLLPTFSNLNGKALKKEVFKIWLSILPILLVSAFVIFLVKDWLIILLFSKKFLLINSLIIFQLLGDTIKINCWVLGNILISKARTKTFIFFQIEWALIFSILTYILVKYYGFSGVAIAYFLAYLIHFILLNLFFKNLLWKKTNLSTF